MHFVFVSYLACAKAFYFSPFIFLIPIILVFKGTTKRKELHGTTCIRALSGTWGEKVDGATFQAYKFEFLCNIPGELYSGFVLLTLNWSFTWSQRRLSLLYLFAGKCFWMQNRCTHQLVNSFIILVLFWEYFF